MTYEWTPLFTIKFVHVDQMCEMIQVLFSDLVILASRSLISTKCRSVNRPQLPQHASGCSHDSGGAEQPSMQAGMASLQQDRPTACLMHAALSKQQPAGRGGDDMTKKKTNKDWDRPECRATGFAGGREISAHCTAV